MSDFWPDRRRARPAPPTPTPACARTGSTPAGARPAPPLRGRVDADLCIVGGGFTGLWAALHAKADDPARDVVVLEADTSASARAGATAASLLGSLTHGIANGLARFGDEMPALERLGTENFAGLRADLDRHGIDCDLELTGDLVALLEPYQDAWIEEEVALLRAYGHDVEVLDGPAMRAEVHSPTYRGGIWDRTDAGLVDPGGSSTGCGRRPSGSGCGSSRAPARRRSVTSMRGARSRSRRPAGACARAASSSRRARSRRCLRAIRRSVVPVYDYALVTEPLDAAQREAVGWRRAPGALRRGQPVPLLPPDAGRPDPVRRLRRRVPVPRPGRPGARRRRALVRAPAAHFFHTFPQLRGLRFSYRWGGAIDTSSRFSVFFGTAHAGRVAYAVGYTGLGVGATRFGARVALDLLDGRDTEATRLRYVRRRPSRSRPSRCAGRSSSSRATASPPPTATRAAAACGCGRSTGSGSGFDS
jgi:glycine/D-amino acid oxidase-like deaminating enzyme